VRPRTQSIDAVCVVIPARNEEAGIQRSIDSVRAAASYLGCVNSHPVSVHVAVVLDRCSDNTAQIVGRNSGVHAIVIDAGQVGRARAAGAATLLAAIPHKRNAIWIANTDADSTVPRNWLAIMIDRADSGADLVLGTVIPDGRTSSHLRQLWTAAHVQRDDHPHVHGANFGIRADAYLSVGGWDATSTGEDVLLADRARSAGYLRIDRIGSIAVTTSGRLVGRAPDGFAGYLQRLTDEPSSYPQASQVLVQAP
jgi:glycosyltransferase involved in cell wall biosynthesis